MTKLICSTICSLAAIGTLVFLELKALEAGINGTLLSFIVIAIAGLGGYNVNQIKKAVKKE